MALAGRLVSRWSCSGLQVAKQTRRHITRSIKTEVESRHEQASVNHDVLTDTFQRKHNYLRISLTERCNLRCQYCMPEAGTPLTPSAQLLTANEVEVLTRLFCSQGVNKVRLTGGEPLVRKDLVDIVKSLAAIPGMKSVSMTTNGVTLSHKLAALHEAGLTGVNVSLDTLHQHKFEFITRRMGWDKVIRGINQALEIGISPVKINCVVMKGLNDDEICDFVAFTEDKLVDVRFIEYMPFDGNKWSMNKFVPYRSMLAQIMERWPQLSRRQDSPNDTSKAYQVPGFKGTIGFITSMSQNFCSTCNRLRLTADGNLKVCLFGAEEVSLRDAMRGGATEDQLLDIIASAVKGKKKQHAGMLTLKDTQNRPMILIGSSSPVKKTKFYHFFPAVHRVFNPFCHAVHRVFNPFHRAVHRVFNPFCRAVTCGWVLPPVTHAMFNPFLPPVVCYCTDAAGLTHIDHKGHAHMVDVGEKMVSCRAAEASGHIILSPQAFHLVAQSSVAKGDVLGVARVAGIMAAKSTPALIPLCHTLSLSHVAVDFDLCKEDCSVLARACVRCQGVTGVEMEALTAVTVALLTIYDMTKAVSKDHVISMVKLDRKSGGNSGDYVHTA